MDLDLIYQGWALDFQVPIKWDLMAQYQGVQIVDHILWALLLE